MDNDFDLHQARKAANIFRYCDDQPIATNYQPIFLSEIVDDLNRNSLEVTKNTVPAIYSLLLDTCRALRVPQSAVQAYVRDDPHFQAISYFSDNRRNVLVLSSKIVNFLNSDELKFVIGHEIGHFLLQHGSLLPSEKALEYFVYRRGQEISADRIGLVACADADAACRALMKTTSGLNDDLLSVSSFDFIGQLDRGNISTGERWDETHPSSVVRAAILHHFSQYIDRKNYSEVTSAEIASIDGALRSKISSWVSPKISHDDLLISNELQMWKDLEQEVKDGVFSTEAQRRIAAKFGIDNLSKIVKLFENMSTQQVKQHITDRIGQIVSISR